MMFWWCWWRSKSRS